MGKEWLMVLILALANAPAVQPDASKPVPPEVEPKLVSETKPVPPTSPVSTLPPANPSTLKQEPATPQPKCDTRPYRSLIGRTISDVLTMRLPPGTRIYRLGDPMTEPIPPGRLNIEINRATRVGRIYCS